MPGVVGPTFKGYQPPTLSDSLASKILWGPIGCWLYIRGFFKPTQVLHVGWGDYKTTHLYGDY